MKSLAVRRRAEDALSSKLQPGELIGAGVAVTSGPSRWGIAVLLAAASALFAAGLADLLALHPSPLLDGPVIGLALPVLGLCSYFLARPRYMVVTTQRLVCLRLSRLRGRPGRLVFAVPLADLRLTNYRAGAYRSVIQCEIPGPRRIRLRVGRSGRQDFAKVTGLLARSGALSRLDPPYPAAAGFGTPA